MKHLAVLCLMFCSVLFSSCEKDFRDGLYTKQVYQDYLYGNGSEKMVYPGYVLTSREVYDSICRNIDRLNPISSNFETDEPVDFNRYIYAFVVDSARSDYITDIEVVTARVYKGQLKIYFLLHEEKVENPVVIRQRFLLLKVEKEAFDTYSFEKL